MTTVAAAAALTNRVRVMTNVVVLPLHNTAVVAKQLATLDVLSAGRLTVGVGVGGREQDYLVAGVPFDRRHHRLDEAVAGLRRLWAGSAPAEGVDPVGPRVFLIGSGALSHTFWPLRELRDHEAAGEEHIFTKEAAAADHQVLDRWSHGDHRAVIDSMPEYLRFRPEGRFGHYLMTVAAVGGRACTARGREYSAYENAIGTGSAHVVFERPEGGWTA